MSNQSPETIADYEVLFALRTGVTVLLPKAAAFDGTEKSPAHFTICKKNPRDVIVNGSKKSFILKNMQKNHIEEAVSRGFIIFYELDKEDEVVRCTQCNYQK